MAVAAVGLFNFNIDTEMNTQHSEKAIKDLWVSGHLFTKPALMGGLMVIAKINKTFLQTKSRRAVCMMHAYHAPSPNIVNINVRIEGLC